MSSVNTFMELFNNSMLNSSWGPLNYYFMTLITITLELFSAFANMFNTKALLCSLKLFAPVPHSCTVVLGHHFKVSS